MKILLTKKIKYLISVAIIYLGFCIKAQVATTSININTTIHPKSNLLLGITMDARSGMLGNSSTPLGYFNCDTTGTLTSGISPLFSNFPMSTIRYPANGIMFGFDWKKSIGHPAYLRPIQNIMGLLGPAQPIQFGFDEFMNMTAAKGLSPKDIQIMTPIYKTGTPGLTPTQTLGAFPDPARFNADWVEYANAPNDGSNPGGGTDWATVRAANGRNNPYGIEIWNLGNEPWGPLEYNFNPTNYLSIIAPIVDSMLFIDPSIKITLPAVGSASTSWNSAILSSTLVSSGKIFGLSPHFFPDELTSSGPPTNGVFSRENALISLAAAAQAKGLKIIVGDHAHGIPGTMSQDLAMQWQGANLTADFLLMISQVQNIDRANFWVYGIPKSQWHPIRENSPGNYSLLAVAELYKKLFPLFLDKSVKAINTSPIASDLNPYSVRASAFASNDNSKLNVIAVNRDKLNTIPLSVNGIAGYSLTNAAILTATALAADSYNENSATINASGDYILPSMSILILQFDISTTKIYESSIDNLISIYPNPASDFVKLKIATAFQPADKITIYNSLGAIVKSLTDLKEDEIYIDTKFLNEGVFTIQIESGKNIKTHKLLILKN
jgi:alpha-L-arabinofuranosidase